MLEVGDVLDQSGSRNGPLRRGDVHLPIEHLLLPAERPPTVSDTSDLDIA